MIELCFKPYRQYYSNITAADNCKDWKIDWQDDYIKTAKIGNIHRSLFLSMTVQICNGRVLHVLS